MSAVCWYVLKTSSRQVLAVRDCLRRAGLCCFVPMCYKVETQKGRKVRHLVPAVTNLVFVHATIESISDFKLRLKYSFHWLTVPKAGHPHEKMVVPDKAMNDFIRVTQQNEQAVTYFRPEELSLNRGDRILIHGGVFDGVEGVLLKVKGKRDRQLVISIPGITAAAVSIRPEIVEIVSEKIKTSHNLQGDCRELIRLSTRMLTSPPDHHAQAPEYDMLSYEIRRLYESLRPLKGFMASVEGELALSLMMAEQVSGQWQAETEERFMRALHKQKAHSLLQVRMLSIGGALLNQPELLQQANQTINLWKVNGPTTRQEYVIAEAGLFANLVK